jgi:hypothetical protein
MYILKEYKIYEPLINEQLLLNNCHRHDLFMNSNVGGQKLKEKQYIFIVNKISPPKHL